MKFGMGQSVKRWEDRRLLTGNGRYTDDHNAPRQARAWFLRSPHAHARIVSIDAAAARKAPGVVAVFTGAEATKELGLLPCRVAAMMPLKRPDGAPMALSPRPPMPADIVRFVGDIVAMVVAETVDQAKDAGEKIEVEYEELPAVADTAAAIAKGAPAVWPATAPDNISYLQRVGNAAAVDAAFAAADHVVGFDWRNTRVAQHPMELRAALGLYDRFEDRYTLISGCQGPHMVRQTLGPAVLKVPESKLRIVSPDMGGGFGMRSDPYPELALVLWAAKKTGRPVKWAGDRAEHFQTDLHGRDSVFKVELALSKDGMFQAVRVKAWCAMGAYLSFFGPLPTFGNIGGLAGVYRTPLIAADVYGVFTHSAPTGPYRGAGRPEAAFCIEQAIDLAARKLGMDRLELRRKNMIPKIEGQPYKTGLSFVYDSGDFPAVLERALKLADVDGYAARRRDSEKRGRLRGLGIACSIEQSAGAFDEGAEIRVDSSGTVTVLVGSHNHGQGHETVFRQLLADKLGVEFEDVKIITGDTDAVPYGIGTFGSRTSGIASTAIVRASDRVLEKMKQIAAHRLEASADDIEFKEMRFAVAGTDKAVSWKEVAMIAHNPRALPPGMETGLNKYATFAPPAPTFPNGCHISEVEIDPETGVLTLERYAVVDDVGTVMNPLLLKGQIQGGVVQGAGQIMMETIRYDDESGQLLTGSLMDYALPRADTMPMIEVQSHPAPTPVNPLGIKGAGEAGTVGALPCVHSAVMDALAPLGIAWFDMPATPDRLWRAIHEARRRKAA